MSTLEKIFLAIIVILLVCMVIFSYREIKEPPEHPAGPKPASRFDESLGQDFKIGSFGTTTAQQSAGGKENNCEQLQPIIIGTLHDIEEHLEKLIPGGDRTFEVNEPTLQLFCNKTATVTLADGKGNTLLLQKMPFTREIPPQGAAIDIGTRVRIQATVVPAGSSGTSSVPTIFGDLLIPDRFLDDPAVPAQ